eukprot:5963091-Pleurochrysis_carterae.AAC.1
MRSPKASQRTEQSTRRTPPQRSRATHDKMDSLAAVFDAALDITHPAPPRSPTPKRVRWSDDRHQQQPPHQAFAHRLAKSGRLFVPERMAMA